MEYGRSAKALGCPVSFVMPTHSQGCHLRARQCTASTQEDPVFCTQRDAERGADEAVAGCNRQLMKWGVREDVCQDVLNPGEHFHRVYVKG